MWCYNNQQGSSLQALQDGAHRQERGKKMMELEVGKRYVAAFGGGTETPGKKFEFRVVSKNKRGFGDFDAVYWVKWLKGQRGKIYLCGSVWCCPYGFDETCGGDEFTIEKK